MKNNEDTVLDNMDFNFEDASEKELKELVKKTYDGLAGLNEKIDKVIKMISEREHVVNNGGHPKCTMLYNNKEITNEELRELNKTLTVAEILRDFTYINNDGDLIIPSMSDEYKMRCRSMITNRIRWGK